MEARWAGRHGGRGGTVGGEARWAGGTMEARDFSAAEAHVLVSGVTVDYRHLMNSLYVMSLHDMEDVD